MKRKELIIAAVMLLLAFGGITIIKYEGHSVSAVTLNKNHQAGAVQLFWAYYNRASQFRTQGNADSAITAYREALKINPAHEDALYYLGNMYMKADHFDSAKETLEKLAALNPQSERAFNQLGNMFFCMTHSNYFHPEQAKTYFTEAYKLNKESLNPNLRLGEIALFQNKPDTTFDIFKKLVDQKNAEVYFILGYLQWKSGKAQNAISALERSIKLGNIDITYDEGGQIISSKNATGSKIRGCNLYKNWLSENLRFPEKFDIRNEMPKIYWKFDQYLMLMRAHLNHD